MESGDSTRLLLKLEVCTLLLWAAAFQTEAASTNLLSPSEAVTVRDESLQQRLAWNLKTLVEPYEKAGHANAKWDEPAKRALTEFARVRAKVTATNEFGLAIISTNVALAVAAGCDDPMVKYLFVRFTLDQTNSKEVFLDSYCKTARDMRESTYPPIRKFYSALWALRQAFYAFGTNSPKHSYGGEMARLLVSNLLPGLSDPTMPAREAYDIANETIEVFNGDTNYYQQVYSIIGKPLAEGWPDAYTTWLWKGRACIHLAWTARGKGWANSVTDEGWKLFDERLAAAEEALQHAWKLYPKDKQICHEMMTVMLGQGGGRQRMEVWFNRAMELDPNDIDACKDKLYYLEPKWHGSEEAQLAFGRECVRSKTWGGKVPLALLDAHVFIQGHLDKSEQTNYWKQPGVWPDVHAAFDRFFELNPDATSWYHNYAWHAYHAEQWAKLNELIPKLGPINYDYFGGKPEFEKMLKLAKEHSNDGGADEKK